MKRMEWNIINKSESAFFTIIEIIRHPRFIYIYIAPQLKGKSSSSYILFKYSFWFFLAIYAKQTKTLGNFFKTCNCPFFSSQKKGFLQHITRNTDLHLKKNGGK